MRLSLDLGKRRAYWDGREISLRRREFDVLAFLFLNVGRVVTREEVIRNIYKGRVEPGSRAVDNSIKRLRKKFPEDLIATSRGVGYYLEEKG